ncbi:unnamed protein product [Peniophora sp. CBMAI 1063]|nr:unnamed protein product [Peniophora sp. CBMAI 1063]
MMLSVDQLPEDVLHDLFDWLSVIDQPTLFIANRAPLVETSLGWITASHVCRRWRSSILSMPLLWAAIAGGVSASQATCETFIERAGRAPLHFWTWHLQHFGRIESHPDYSVSPLRRMVAQLTPRYRDRLERLALYIASGRRMSVDGGISDQRDLAIVEKCSFPQLKDLYLESDDHHIRVTAAFEAPKLENLYMNQIFLAFRAPILRFLRIDSRQVVSFKTLRDGIASSPLLEELELGLYNVYDLVDDASLPPNSHKKIRLPRLAVLHYHGTCQPFRLLREAIDVPTTALLSMDLSETTQAEVIFLFTYTRDFISHPKNDSLRLSFTDDNNTKTFHVQIYQSTAAAQHATADGMRSRSGVYVYLRDSGIWPRGDEIRSLMTALLAAAELGNIRYLDFDRISDACFETEEIAMFQRVLRPLTDVTSVSVGRESDLHFAHRLLCPDAPASPLFPHLRSLVLKPPRDTIPQLASSSLRVLSGVDGPRQHMETK